MTTQLSTEVTITGAMLKPLEVDKGFNKTNVDTLLNELQKQLDAANVDTGTKKGLDSIRSTANNIRRSKKFFTDHASKLTADLKEEIKEITSVSDYAVTRLEEIREEYRKPLTEHEEAEKLRQNKLANAIAEITEIGVKKHSTPEEAKQALEALEGVYKPNTYEEREKDAEHAYLKAKNDLQAQVAHLEAVAEQQAEIKRMQEAAAEAKAAAEKELAEAARIKAEAEALAAANAPKQEAAPQPAQAAEAPAEPVAAAQQPAAKQTMQTGGRTSGKNTMQTVANDIAKLGVPMGMAMKLANAIAAGEISHVKLVA